MDQEEKTFSVCLTHLNTGTGLPIVQIAACDGPWIGDPWVDQLIEWMLQTEDGIFTADVFQSNSTNDEELFAHLLAGQVGHGRRLRVVHLEWNNAGQFIVYVRPDTVVETPCLINYTG